MGGANGGIGSDGGRTGDGGALGGAGLQTQGYVSEHGMIDGCSLNLMDTVVISGLPESSKRIEAEHLGGICRAVENGVISICAVWRASPKAATARTHSSLLGIGDSQRPQVRMVNSLAKVNAGGGSTGGEGGYGGIGVSIFGP